ncbi:MAG: hypothetical protein LBJ00_10485, partial [Planctomycetaceae bacterium]|nr:hypothetical protein [Planctomycetaceae bacterium]
YFIRTGSELVKEYHHQPDDENMDIITSVLCEMVSDPKERKLLEDEAEAMRILDAVYFSKIRENNKTIEEQAKILEEKDKALGEKDKAFEEQSKVLEEKDKQIAELQRLLQSN